MKHDSEEWEDGDTDPGDGCSATCIIEEFYACTGGSVSEIDTCTYCPDQGESPNDDKKYCQITCGDGMRYGDEFCDDGNTNPTTDGCSST